MFKNTLHMIKCIYLRKFISTYRNLQLEDATISEESLCEEIFIENTIEVFVVRKHSLR